MTARSPLHALWLAAALCACAGARARHPSTYNARKALAQELVHRSDWPRAFALVNELHREDPKDAEVLTLRGLVYREQRLDKEAEADLTEALKLRRDDAFAHSCLAVLLDQEGRGAEALQHHRRAAELEPLNAGYLNNLGFSLLAHGRPREAIPVFQEALRNDPTNGRIRNNLGFAYGRAGDFASAAMQFEMGGGQAEAKNNLGYAYQIAKNLGQAYELYVEAIRLDPALARARQNLREVAKRLGRPIPADLPAEPRS